MKNARNRIQNAIRNKCRVQLPAVGKAYKAFNEVQIEIETKVGWLLFSNDMKRVEKRYYEETQDDIFISNEDR